MSVWIVIFICRVTTTENIDKEQASIALLCKHVECFCVIHGMSSAEFTLPKRALTHAKSATA